MGGPSVRTEVRLLSSPDLPLRRSDPAEIDRTPHAVERRIRRALTAQPELRVSDLVIRRVGDAVCLTGIVETLNGATDVCGLVKQIAGVEGVMNRLLVRTSETRSSTN